MAMIAPIGISRVVLKDHSFFQVMNGTGLGCVIGLFFVFIMWLCIPFKMNAKALQEVPRWSIDLEELFALPKQENIFDKTMHWVNHIILWSCVLFMLVGMVGVWPAYVLTFPVGYLIMKFLLPKLNALKPVKAEVEPPVKAEVESPVEAQV